MTNWEDYFWRVSIKGDPDAIVEFAGKVNDVGRLLSGYGKESKDLVVESNGDGKGKGDGWQGPAGRAYRGFATERVTKPLDDRAAKLGPVSTQLMAAVQFLREAQQKMPRAAVGVSEGWTLADPKTGEIEGSFNWKSVAKEWYGQGLDNVWLSWNGGRNWLLPKGKPADSPEIQGQIDAWYAAGSALAKQVYDELNEKYSGIAPEMRLEPYKPETGDGSTKPTGDDPPGGGPEKTGGGPDGTKPKVPEKDTTTPETKPENEPRPEQNPEGEPEQPPGGEEQPPGGEEPPPGTEPEPYEPEPYEPDPYDPDPYEPPKTGLAGAGGGDLGGGGGGLGGGGLGASAPVGSGLAGPGAGTAGPGLVAAGGAGAVGGGRGAGFLPGGGHGGQGGGGQDTETWLTEDEDPWHGDENTAPPVVGI